MILTNGRIYTQDPAYQAATAMAIRHDYISAIGSDEAIVGLAGPQDERIDLRGRTVIPGLVDAHIHLLWYAQSVQRIDLIGASSLAYALDRVRAHARKVEAGSWLLGRGWNQNLWPDGSFPTAFDLDRVVPDHPVYLIAQSGHAGWANSLALARAGIDLETPDPPGAQIQRDAGGLPTGILFEDGAMDLVEEVIGQPTPEEAALMIGQAIPSLWRAGITGVHCMDGWPAYQGLELLNQQSKLGLRVVKYLPLDHLDEVVEMGLCSGNGDDWLRIGGLKLFADGALGVRTAAMLRPYQDEPENWGILTLERKELERVSRMAADAGLSVAVHAIGDRANRMVLDTLEEISPSGGFPHRIEHVQLLDPADLDRLACLNITGSVQPIHAPSDMEMADRYWGDRTASAYAYRSLLDAGTRLAFGSDAPVESFEPLLGIHAAVTRCRRDGQPSRDGWHSEQRITVAEALAGFTSGAAAAVNMTNRLGSLSPGKLADLVVLDRDITAIDPAEIPDIRVEGTMIGGNWVFPLERP